MNPGGGTSRVSVVDVMEGAIEVRASSGEGFLGGEDFTRALAGRVLARRGLNFERAEVEAPRRVARLLQQCEAAKLALSRGESASIRVPGADGGLDDAPAEAVTREEFAAWTDHVLAGVEPPIRRALADAGLKRSDVDEVILVGGATRMPAVAGRVRGLFGKEPLRRINPDEVVALGAAVQAGLIAREASLDDLVVTDVSPFTLGIEISKRLGLEHREGYFLPIIGRNTTIPASRSHRVATAEPNQSEIRIRIFQGEGRRVEENTLLGEFLVPGIPRGPAGQEIDVRFTYDLNGVLDAEATIVATRAKVSHVVTRLAHGLSERQIAAAVEAMQALKAHPREEAPNRLLLRRAERLYAELGPEARAALGQLLDGFEEALGIGDREAVDRHREALAGFLELHDPGREGAGDDGW